MQRRLTIALVSTAIAAIALVGLGVLALWQQGVQDRAEDDVESRLEAVEALLDGRVDRDSGIQIDPRRLRSALGLEALQVVVVDEDGNLTALPNLTNRGDDRSSRSADDDGSDADPLTKIDPDLVDELADGETVMIVHQDAVVGLKKVAEGRQAGGLAAVLARQRFESAPIQVIAWFMVSSLVVVLGAFLAARLLARRLVGPLSGIEQATARIAGGDLSTRLEVTGSDEVAQLGHSVNTMATELERSKALDQQFLMSVSHDLRTPLTVISGYAEALSEGATDDPEAAGIVIAGHADRLERLVNDLLDLARLDANRFQFDLAPVDLTVAVGRTTAGFQPQAESAGVELQFECGSETVVEADPARLEQIVGNLIDNSIKFAHSRVDVVVRSDTESDAATDTESRTVVVTVSDDGPGIGPDDLPHVFDRLYVSKAQPDRAENPLGLGLAIARDLTTALNGTIEVSNRPEGGARFTLKFPAR